MSRTIERNKILAGILASGLMLTGLHEASAMIFEPARLECSVGDFLVGPSQPPMVLQPIDWGTMLPVADVAQGEAVFGKCQSCHKLDDANGTGPGLAGVVGRKTASHGGFSYSPAMLEYRQAKPRWSFDELDAFLRKPGAHVPGTKMTFVGIKSTQDRINLIAFLHTKGSTLAIPRPDPSRQGVVQQAVVSPAVEIDWPVFRPCTN